MVASLMSGIVSCSDDDKDYSNELEEIKKQEGDLASKIDALVQLQESLAKKQDDLNKLQESLTKQQEELTKQQEEFKKLQEDKNDQELTAKAEELQKLQEEFEKQQEELKKQQEELAKQQQEFEKLKEEFNQQQEEENSDSTGTLHLKYDDPQWKSVEVSGDYVYSMMVVFELPSTLRNSATENDVIAAFVGDECRAVAKEIDGIYMLTVIGTGEEDSDVVFRYWNADTHYMYESLVKTAFTSDKIMGVVDAPVLFLNKQM